MSSRVPLPPVVAQALAGYPLPDAFTMSVELANGAREVVTLVFIDKVGVELPDGFARLTAVLAHEIYGNAARFLAEGVPVRQGRIESEVAAYTRGIEAIGRVRDLLLTQDSPTTRKVAADLERCLERDRRSLAGWQSALGRNCATRLTFKEPPK